MGKDSHKQPVVRMLMVQGSTVALMTTKPMELRMVRPFLFAWTRSHSLCNHVYDLVGYQGVDGAHLLHVPWPKRKMLPGTLSACHPPCTGGCTICRLGIQAQSWAPCGGSRGLCLPAPRCFWTIPLYPRRWRTPSLNLSHCFRASEPVALAPSTLRIKDT